MWSRRVTQDLGENMRWSILNAIWEDKSVLAPRGAAVTVEDVKVRKEAARIEVTEQLCECVG